MPSLLRQAFERVHPLIPVFRRIVVASDDVDWILEELPELSEENLWLLPPGYQTPMVQIGWAALRLWHLHPDALMVVMPENHLLSCRAQTHDFCHLLQVGEAIVRRTDALVVFGTAIPSPKTVGIGEEYLQVDTKAPRTSGVAFPVQRFLDSWDLSAFGKKNRTVSPNEAFFLNRHTYLWRVSTFQKLMRVHQPAISEGLKYLHCSFGTTLDERALAERDAALKRVSIEEGILAHAQNVWMVGTERGWYEIRTIADLTEALAQMESEGKDQ